MAFAALPLLLMHVRVEAQPAPSGALLRCDPWTVIKAIDGRRTKVVAAQAGAFTDCEIPLAAGRHTMRVCYEGRGYTISPPMNVTTLYRCERDRDVEFEAADARVYRLRLSLESGFAPHVEDVTAVERDVPAAPARNSRRGVPAEQRESVILVRVPEGAVPAFLQGTVQHLWFKASRMAQAFAGPAKLRAEPDGYFIGTAEIGDTVSLRRIVAGGVTAFVCDTEVPVYEDLPGGRVLYLGDYHVESVSDGMRFDVTHDLAAARRFLATHHPELVDKLETAGVRDLRVPEPCLLAPAGQRLRRAAR